MKTFHVMTNADKDPDSKITGRIRDHLAKQGCECSLETLQRDFFDEGYSLPQGTDCVIVAGGDGTMIQAADLVGGSVPIIGVNLGTLGFLSEIEVDRLEEMLDRLIADDFETEERMMLTGECGRKMHALNDIVISRNGSVKILNLEIYVNDLLLGVYTADGMIVSTPTGSTAYNLSAGGPIVEPSAKTILLSPICPHNLNSRSIVLSSDDVIRIRIGESSYAEEKSAAATFDGSREITMMPGDSITIRRSFISTKLIKPNRESFLKILSAKLGARADRL